MIGQGRCRYQSILRGREKGERGWARELSAPQNDVVGLPSSAVQPSFSFNCRNIKKRTGDSLDFDDKIFFRFNSCSPEKSHTLQNPFFNYLLGQ